MMEMRIAADRPGRERVISKQCKRGWPSAWLIGLASHSSVDCEIRKGRDVKACLRSEPGGTATLKDV